MKPPNAGFGLRGGFLLLSVLFAKRISAEHQTGDREKSIEQFNIRHTHHLLRFCTLLRRKPPVDPTCLRRNHSIFYSERQAAYERYSDKNRKNGNEVSAAIDYTSDDCRCNWKRRYNKIHGCNSRNGVYTEGGRKLHCFLETTKDSATELELGIFDSDTNCFMGMCTLENICREDSACEIGYWLSKPYIGKGYMTECVRSLVQYAQEELGISRINAFVIKEHERSIALLERLGFKRRELLKKDTENKGKAVDRIWYQLTL